MPLITARTGIDSELLGRIPPGIFEPGAHTGVPTDVRPNEVPKNSHFASRAILLRRFLWQ